MNSFAQDEIDYEKIGSKYEVSGYILQTFGEIESKKNAYAIGAISSNKKTTKRVLYYLKKLGIKFKYSSNYKYIYIDSKTESDALLALYVVEKFGLNYDVGFMQISSSNIKRMNLDIYRLVKDIPYSIDIGAMLFSSCLKTFNYDILNSLECYNKGTNTKKFNYKYAEKFLLAYKKNKPK